MNWKKFWLAALLVYLVFVATTFIIHSLILGGYYMKPDVQSAWRPEEQRNKFA